MPYPAGVNFAKLELFFKGADKVWSSILYYTTISAFPGSFDIANLVNAFNVQLQPSFQDCMHATASILGTDMAIHNGGLVRTISTFQNLPGNESTGVLLPDETAAVVQRLTDTAGKSGRGRIYCSGLSSFHITENRLNASGKTQFINLAATLKLALVNQTMTWSPANYSQKMSAFHAAIQFSPANVLGSQRHRKARR